MGDIMISQQIKALERELKDTQFKRDFAVESAARLEQDIADLEQEMRDIQNDINRLKPVEDRRSTTAIKWPK
jgi:peptidoglycan hydrolase CwlO-like protein